MGSFYRVSTTGFLRNRKVHYKLILNIKAGLAMEGEPVDQGTAKSNSPPEPLPHFLWIQRGLMATFAGVVTLWYFTSPYLVHPHPKFGEDMTDLINNLSSPNEGEKELTFPLRAKLEW